MILRPLAKRDLAFFLLLLSWSVPAIAQDNLNCNEPLHLSNLVYDFSSLDGEKTITRRRPTPPTHEVDSVRLSLCSDLKSQDIPESDECPPGTRVCLTKINEKNGEERITSVIPIAQTSSLNPTYVALSSPKGVSILLHGASYPHPINTTDTQQSVLIKLLCDPSPSEPKFISYDGEKLEIEWSAPGGCGFVGDDGTHEDEGEKPEPEKPRSGGLSSMGWFLLLFILAFATYMGLGAYYNYSTYGASGMDLIPHRDFWSEVPYMLRDVMSHLCATVRPRRSSSHRGGYIAV